MATLNVRVDDKLKQAAFAVFDDLGVSPSDAIRDYLAYVADNGKLPIRQVWVDDERMLNAIKGYETPTLAIQNGLSAPNFDDPHELLAWLDGNISKHLAHKHAKQNA